MSQGETSILLSRSCYQSPLILGDDLGVTFLERFLKLKRRMLVAVVICEVFETMH
jgi:hypothetical protein